MKTLFTLIAFALSANAADTGAELAAKLSASQQDGSSLVRLKMESRGVTLQLQIKQRRTASATEVVYQILWPKERLGEAVLLKKNRQPRRHRHPFRAPGHRAPARHEGRAIWQ